MKDIGQAARDLITHLDYPPWLSAVVVGWEDDRPAIILYLVSNPASPVQVLEDGCWEGHPVVSKYFGSYAPVGLS
jgi:hypothetical protein